MKWRGEFEVLRVVYPNEILADGLELLGTVLSGAGTGNFASLRLEDAQEAEIVTEPADVSYAKSGNELTITSVADFTAQQVTQDVAFAVLVSNTGQLLARAAITATAGQAVEVTRRDIFTVNQ